MKGKRPTTEEKIRALREAYPDPPEVTVMADTKPAITVATAAAVSPAKHLATRSQRSPAKIPTYPDCIPAADTRAFRGSTPTCCSGLPASASCPVRRAVGPLPPLPLHRPKEPLSGVCGDRDLAKQRSPVLWRRDAIEAGWMILPLRIAEGSGDPGKCVCTHGRPNRPL